MQPKVSTAGEPDDLVRIVEELKLEQLTYAELTQVPGIPGSYQRRAQRDFSLA